MKKFTLLLFAFLPCLTFGQYLETFPIQDRGVLPGTCAGTEASCTVDYTGVDWVINGDFTGMDANDFFRTDGAGKLHGDGDVDATVAPGICFETPVLDISGAGGAVSFSIDLEWVSWDVQDIANVAYQLDGGSWVQVPPLAGTDGPGTVDFNSDANSGTGVASASGLTGNTLSIRVCLLETNSLADDIFIDNVSVPEAGVNVLPVEMFSFSAEEGKKKVILKWVTATELNNEKFEIEESRDGREFQKIGTVEGKGTTLEQQNYSFKVENPRNGISYYRLKQIDFDGQFEYSKVISVNFKGENGEVGEFYPNPSKSGMVNLDYTSHSDNEMVVSVFDITGKLVVNQIQQVSSGDNDLSFDFSNLNTGIYIVKIGDERNPVHRKLIIER